MKGFPRCSEVGTKPSLDRSILICVKRHMLNPFKYIRSPFRKRLKLSVRIRIRVFFRYASPPTRSEKRNWSVVMSEFWLLPFYLFLLFSSLDFLFRFVFRPSTRDLDFSSLLYSSYSHGAGLGNKALPLSSAASSNSYQGAP